MLGIYIYNTVEHDRDSKVVYQHISDTNKDLKRGHYISKSNLRQVHFHIYAEYFHIHNE